LITGYTIQNTKSKVTYKTPKARSGPEND